MRRWMRCRRADAGKQVRMNERGGLSARRICSGIEHMDLCDVMYDKTETGGTVI